MMQTHSVITFMDNHNNRNYIYKDNMGTPHLTNPSGVPLSFEFITPDGFLLRLKLEMAETPFLMCDVVRIWCYNNAYAQSGPEPVHEYIRRIT